MGEYSDAIVHLFRKGMYCFFGNSVHPFPKKQYMPFRSRVQVMFNAPMSTAAAAVFLASSAQALNIRKSDINVDV